MLKFSQKFALPILGTLLPLIVWLTAKYVIDISDRYLPNPFDVLLVFTNNDVDIYHHLMMSVLRITSAFIASVIISIYLGIYLYRDKLTREFLMPTIQSLRAIPAAATVPFFILWFGFSEGGKFLLFILGISLNLIISVVQIMQNID